MAKEKKPRAGTLIGLVSVVFGILGVGSAVLGLIKPGSIKLTDTTLGLYTWTFTVGNVVLLAGSLLAVVAGVGLISLHPRAKLFFYLGFGLMAISTLFVWLVPSFRLFGAGNILPVVLGVAMILWLRHKRPKVAPPAPAQKPAQPETAEPKGDSFS